MDKLIYLASPYSSDNPHVIENRVSMVQKATAAFIEQGFLIFSPIVHSHPIHDLVSFSPVNTTEALSPWLRYDRAMIDKADELWVLCLDGWNMSRGVAEEIAHASMTGKTVRFFEYPSLKERGFLKLKNFASETHTSYVPEPLYSAMFDCVDCGKEVEVERVRCGECVEANGVEAPQEGHSCVKCSRLLPDAENLNCPKQIIIGLNGVARAGKDTVGNYLVENEGFVRVGLADAVRDALEALDPIIYARDHSQDLHGVGDREGVGLHLSHYLQKVGASWENLKGGTDGHGPTFYPRLTNEVRTLLQKLGTEVGREFFGENCWIEIARAKIEAAYPNPVVITDIRFDNEAEFVRELGGEVWEITRSGFGPVNDHATEQKLDENLIDFHLFNIGNLDLLYEQIETRLDG